MSKIRESKVAKFTISDGREFLDKVEAEYEQSKLEITELFYINDFEHGTKNFSLNGSDMATLINASKILTKYNQV